MMLCEIEECLKGMRVIIDSREQDNERLQDRIKAFHRAGFQTERRKLDCGDYSADLFFDGDWHPLPVSIERKQGLDEIALNFTRGRKRFAAEFTRAKGKGIRMYLLIEDGSLDDVFFHRYRSALHPNAFISSFFSLLARFDVKPVFCRRLNSPKVLLEILYREGKNYLEGVCEDGTAAE